MRTKVRFLAALLVAGASLGIAVADGPAADEKKGPNKAVEGLANRLMAFDRNKDGKLTKDEITDDRLLGLFNRADANRDGVVTEAELLALANREAGGTGGDGERGGKFGRGEGGRGGKGGKGDRGPRGFGPPGQVLAAPVQEALRLSDQQKKELGDLQKEVDARLQKLLTPEQLNQLKEFRPGGGPGGRGFERGKGKGRGDGE